MRSDVARRGRRFVLAAGIASALLPSPSPAAPSHDVPLFMITKSENRNYVQCAVRLDAQCAPEGAAPVHAYWRMIERGPDVVEPLLGREQPAYGLAEQRVIARRDGGRIVQIALRALPREAIVIDARPGANGCEARARTSIAGIDARLYDVHAVLRWPFGVARLVVTGWSLADGRVVRDERHP